MGALFRRLSTGDVIEPGVSPNGKFVSPDQVNKGPNKINFDGSLALNNPIGTLWPDFEAAGALEITIDEDSIPGGCDSIRITADGNTITLDSTFTWVNIGTDPITETDGAVNELIFLAKRLTRNSIGNLTGGTILYTNKLNPS